jgi:methylmalonyl-CoA mutase N-terminal domain/subunit
MHVRIHTHTSGAVLTAQQPLVNLVRATLHTLGAALAGTQAMEVSAYDEALAIPTEEAATLALRTQQVIREETNVTAVSDPLAGSYFVEALTDAVAQRALDLVEKIEELGGYTAAQQTDWIRAEVEESAGRWREDVDAGRRRIVGLNCHTVADEPAPPVFQVDPGVEQVAVRRIEELRATRDAGRHEDAIGRFREAAETFAATEIPGLGDGKLMLAAIDAARAEASTGEMMGVLKAALGWRAPHVS